ncbi:hypothetical protein J31TS6_53980 [Brevibacillus reuszeri]|nr:hypothetical protein J31TS6_53980 [Brevibacillus reuszeri]
MGFGSADVHEDDSYELLSEKYEYFVEKIFPDSIIDCKILLHRENCTEDKQHKSCMEEIF